jgi:hypothetical protein
VFRIPSMGGSPQPWTARDPNGAQHAAPHLLPGGRGLVFTNRVWDAGYRYSLRAALPGKADSRSCSRRPAAAATSRELKRAVGRYILNPLADEYIDGKVAPGSTVICHAAADRIDVLYGTAKLRAHGCSR